MPAQVVDLQKLAEAQEAADAALEAATLAAEKVAEAMASAPSPDRAVPFNTRLRLSSVVEIEARARREGVSRKLVLCRALAAYGINMATADLEDGTPRRTISA